LRKDQDSINTDKSPASDKVIYNRSNEVKTLIIGC